MTTVQDFEYYAPDGDKVRRVHCMTTKNIETGEERVYSEDELLRMDRSPIPKNETAVSYAEPAESGCYLSLGWPLRKKVIDLFAEYKILTNGDIGGASMLDAADHFGIETESAGEKEEMRALAMTGRDLTNDERRRMERYCLADVRDEAEIFKAMAPRIDGNRALFRGQAGVAFAVYHERGIPADVGLYERILDSRPGLRKAFIKSEPLARAVYTDDLRFNHAQFGQLLVKMGWDDRWPRSDNSGVLKTDADTFSAMREIFPEVAPLGRIIGIVAQLNNFEISIGSDGRIRSGGGLYGSKTGRTQPRKNIFGKHAAFRKIVRATDAHGLILADYTSQEIQIAAILSGDAAMLEDLQGDIYMAFAGRAGLCPVGAKRADHPEARAISKTCVLGILYGMGAETLSRRIGKPLTVARQLINAHKRAYPRFHSWIEEQISVARLRGRIIAPLGWSMNVSDTTKTTTLRNWPMQATGSEIMRAVTIRAMEQGLELVECLHDGFVFQAPGGIIETGAERIRETMSEASASVLGGHAIGIDVEIVPPGEPYPIGSGEKFWRIMADAMEAKGVPA